MFGEIYSGSKNQQKNTTSSLKKVHDISSEEQLTMSLIDNRADNFKNLRQKSIENLCL